MEKKPNKKEELTLVNNVLKLATKLLKVPKAQGYHDTRHIQMFNLLANVFNSSCQSFCSGAGYSVQVVRFDHEPSAVQHHTGGHPVRCVGSHI